MKVFCWTYLWKREQADRSTIRSAAYLVDGEQAIQGLLATKVFHVRRVHFFSPFSDSVSQLSSYVNLQVVVSGTAPLGGNMTIFRYVLFNFRLHSIPALLVDAGSVIVVVIDWEGFSILDKLCQFVQGRLPTCLHDIMNQG